MKVVAHSLLDEESFATETMAAEKHASYTTVTMM